MNVRKKKPRAALVLAIAVAGALDGFGIYVEYNSRGQLLTDADLVPGTAAPRS